MTSSPSQAYDNTNYVNISTIPEDRYLIRYLPLYQATLKGDWETANTFLQQYPRALTAHITSNSETILHVAVGTGSIPFLENLLEKLTPGEITLMNRINHTALHKAAVVGKVEVAKLLVKKNPNLPNIWVDGDSPPLLIASTVGNRRMIIYLLTVTKPDIYLNPQAGKFGFLFMTDLLSAGFYDLALDLLHRCPRLAWEYPSPLSVVVQTPIAFPSGTPLMFWHKWIYSCVPLILENNSQHGNGNVENPTTSFCCVQIKETWAQFLLGKYFVYVCQKLHMKLWDVLDIFVPPIKRIRDTKLKHHQAFQFVKSFFMEVINEENSKATKILSDAFFLAAECGAHEVTELIVDLYPDAIAFLQDEKHTIFHIAILNRREKVFNLIYQTAESKHLVSRIFDSSGNNIFHLAGKLAPPHRLNLVAGAALRMQRELQWFKEVENFILPSHKQVKNSEGKTPAMIFSEEHKELVKEGEQWMKGTANSCTVAATLIGTVAFAAAITVPGGNNQVTGHPIFSREIAFVIFAVADALSLFSSTEAVLTFLSILTSRYSEVDFLFSLPNRLLIGLVSLVISITTMMIAFSATLCLIFGGKAYIVFPVAALACVPVTMFVSSKSPLLADTIKSTFGPGIFGKRSNRVLM